MNQLQTLALSFRADLAAGGADGGSGAAAAVRVKHTEGPEGVRGRNSDNKIVREVLGWEPTILLKDGLRVTYDWIVTQVEAEREAGVDVSVYCSSNVVTQTTESLDSISVGGGGAAAPAVAVVEDAKAVGVPESATAATADTH